MTDTHQNTAHDTAAANATGEASTIDKITKTTAEDRADFIAKAQETLSGAVATAVDAVKANPKTAAAIAAGATAVVAGAAYGATKLANTKTSSKPGTNAKDAPGKRTPAANKK